MWKTSIGGVLFVWSALAVADAPCKSIADANWRDQCVQQQSSLLVGKFEVQAVPDIQAALEQSRVMSWAVRENNTFANAMQQSGDWSGALAKRKQESSARKQVFQLAISIAAYFDESDQGKDRKALYRGLVERNVEDAEQAYGIAEELWEKAIAATDPKEAAQMQALAERILRNAGDTLALAAEGANRNEKLKLSRKLWQQSAEMSEQLLQWKLQIGSGKAEVNFFRQRAAARWYQSALVALLNDDTKEANFAKQQSENLLVARR
ncbi:hypothetical protein G8770_02415 [Aestuariicella hydrocarbonica]|uniref:Uncharacterized protein n=1 Tax=Pseudomaricurvus hydrocarbonicus TaxID=1470433 RepID=A0A9E5MGA1_9GAMM|nr:hypothetical protein [Aestuariicella hydrocarbonica]NHO64401.1 hypothetical protein [Aestuariicella hydrocarbonica]